MLAGVNAAAQTFTAGGINYNVTSEDNMNCEVVENYQTGYSGDVVIPAQVTADGKTYTVTAVGENAFINDEVKSVKLPNTVTEIKNSAFYMCQNLTDVDLGGNVKTIGYSVFQYCTSLGSIELPNTLTSVGGMTFNNSGLTTVTIPASVTTVGIGAFSGCPNLRSAVINCAVTSQSMFLTCSSLEEVTIGSGVTSIASSMFQMCPNLQTVTMLGSAPLLPLSAIMHFTTFRLRTQRSAFPKVQPVRIRVRRAGAISAQS